MSQSKSILAVKSLFIVIVARRCICVHKKSINWLRSGNILFAKASFFF